MIFELNFFYANMEKFKKISFRYYEFSVAINIFL